LPPPESLQPIHAQGFFSVSPSGFIHQIIVYDYYDPEEYYAKLIHRPLEYEEEMERLRAAMQEALDEEEVIVNGVRVYPEVQAVSLEHRMDPRLPYITFLITFSAPLRRGINVYENRYEEEVIEYDYEVFWLFPPGAKVREVVTRTEYEVLGDGNILLLWARKGDRSGSYEKIVFEIP
jgi:hypothetical protein